MCADFNLEFARSHAVASHKPNVDCAPADGVRLVQAELHSCNGHAFSLHSCCLQVTFKI